MYTKLENLGSYGPQFQNLRQVWRNSSGNVLLARLQVPTSLKVERYHMHPAVLDAVFHMVGFITNAPGRSKSWVPARIARVEFCQGLGRGQFTDSSSIEEDGVNWTWASVRVVRAEEKLRELDFTLYDALTGEAMMSLAGFVVMPLKPAPPASALYQTRWSPAPMNRGHEIISEGNVAVLALPGNQKVDPAGAYRIVSAPLALDQWHDIETLVLPTAESCSGSTLVDILEVFQSASGYIRGHAADKRELVIAVVTAHAEGPTMVESSAKSLGMGSGAVWGLVRTVRMELGPKVTVLCLDSDAPNFGTILGQMRIEVDFVLGSSPGSPVGSSHSDWSSGSGAISIARLRR